MAETRSTPAPTGHARLSPSSSSRWLCCPFSATVELPRTESVAAATGTEAHGWAADVLTRNCDAADVPDVFQKGVSMYVAHVRSSGCDTPIIERRWESLSIPEFSGTADCVLVEDHKLTVYDYKHGRYGVKAEGNTQLLCYASIVAEHFEIDTFLGVIVQPNSSSREKIKVAEFAPHEVDSHRERVAAAAGSDEKHTGFHCLFCPLLATGQCDEGREYARKAGWLTKYRHLRGI